GIRDFHVTGVQTCALPISATQPVEPTLARATATPAPTQEITETAAPTATPVPTIAITDKLLKGLNITIRHPFYDASDEFNQMIQIGRASCRERVRSSVREV